METQLQKTMVDGGIIKTMGTDSPFNSRAADYDRWFDEKDGKIIFATEVTAFQEVLPLLPKPWLEIGVGSGRFAEALRISTGLDPAEKLLEMARGRGIMTLQGKVADRILPSESFGTVFLIMTLCFMDNPVIALQEIHHTLKPHGRLALGVVPAESAWGIAHLQKKQAAHPFYEHANFYTYQELKSLLKDTGFAMSITISTLFQQPGHLTGIETPLTDFHRDAGFLVIVADKIPHPPGMW